MTRKENAELGTHIEIEGSKFIRQEPIICNQGSIFTVKNLFYNIPARRRFLKGDALEFKHIIDEFHRVVIAHPEIAFSLIHNDTEIYSLSASNLKQRIVHIFGKNLSNELLDISVETSIISINGFIGKPNFARKKGGLQFFFVNNRYMRHPFLYRTFLNAYETLLAPETLPSYVVFFTCDPNTIDVNIHPTKTEIKFEDERAVAQILESAVRQTLGKTNMMPTIDFNTEAAIKLPFQTQDKTLSIPKIPINSDYNPFNDFTKKPIPNNWEKLFDTKIEQPSTQPVQPMFEEQKETTQLSGILQFKHQYLLIPVKSGLMIINQHRAHTRILYEMLVNKYTHEDMYSEKLIFPENITLSAHDHLIFKELIPHLQKLGFIISESGNDGYNIEGIPHYWTNFNLASAVEQFIKNYVELEKTPDIDSIHHILASLASSSAIANGQLLSENEMQYIFDSLFSTTNPQYTPRGEIIFYIIKTEEVEHFFN
jgi:DNA mismatch repair protein MutL